MDLLQKASNIHQHLTCLTLLLRKQTQSITTSAPNTTNTTLSALNLKIFHANRPATSAPNLLFPSCLRTCLSPIPNTSKPTLSPFLTRPLRTSLARTKQCHPESCHVQHTTSRKMMSLAYTQLQYSRRTARNLCISAEKGSGCPENSSSRRVEKNKNRRR